MTAATPRALLTCVGENRPGWFPKMENLVLSIRRFGGSLADAPIVVHTVDGADDSFVGAIERLGGRVRVVDSVDRRLPSSNKFRMFELADEEEFDVLVGLDCDVIVMGDLAPELRTDALRALPAGQTHLDDEGWERLYAARGLPLPAKDCVTAVTGQRTYPYFNSGVLFVPRQHCRPLAEAWASHLAWLLDGGASRLGLGRIRRDQIPFALALASAQLRVERLPLNLNLSTTQPRYARLYRDETGPPFVFHYHRGIDENGFLRPTVHRSVNEWFDRFNEARAAVTATPYTGLGRVPARERVRAAARSQGWYRRGRRRLAKRSVS